MVRSCGRYFAGIPAWGNAGPSLEDQCVGMGIKQQAQMRLVMQQSLKRSVPHHVSISPHATQLCASSAPARAVVVAVRLGKASSLELRWFLRARASNLHCPSLGKTTIIHASSRRDTAAGAPVYVAGTWRNITHSSSWRFSPQIQSASADWTAPRCSWGALEAHI
jgi:hypothetical protein